MWLFCLSLSAVILALTAFLTIFGKRINKFRNDILTPSRIIFCGTLLSGVVLFFPPFYETFSESPYNLTTTLIMSVISTVQMFAIDANLDIITDAVAEMSTLFKNTYTFAAIVLFALAPVSTLGLALSFFKNIAARNSYIAHYNSDVFVFSDLNDKSLTLAESLCTKAKKELIIFTNTRENSGELYWRAKNLGAICFDDDIIAVNFSHHSRRKSISFFAISADEAENTRVAIALRDKYNKLQRSMIYVFSSNIESEILLSGASSDSIIIRRVNDYESLIVGNLYKNGIKLFRGASEYNETERLISVAIIGFDKYAKAMTKALVWYCQMDGYRVEIDVFSGKKDTFSEFSAECPELMSPDFNGKFDDFGDARYKITFHDDIGIGSLEYANAISKLTKLSYSFISLASDEENLSAAVKLRQLCEKHGTKPIIQTIISNTEKKEALINARNYKGQSYDIDFIGDIKSHYSAETILGDDITKEALSRHMKWGNEEDFWRFEYNSKSSIASAIHRRAKIECNISGADVEVSQRTEEEKYNLRRLEHRRWNAYIRSEGYTYGEVRNDLAKTHNCLVPFDELPPHEQEKDDD